MLYTNKRLKQTNRFKEYENLVNQCYKTSLRKEKKQQDFFDRVDFVNAKTGEVFKKNHNFENEYKKYTKSIEQKVYAVEKIARDKGLVPIFITLTLPSSFHPFRSIGYKGERLYTNLNPYFQFDSIDTAIKEGYQYLNLAYRTFYKRVKNKVKDLMFVKVVEAHKTMLPHFHILFFIKPEKNWILFLEFDKIRHEFRLNQTDFNQTHENEQLNDDNTYKKGVNRAAKYVMKYITKNINDTSEIFFARVLDGWKRIYKIRMITTSNLPLSLLEFRTIYHSLNKETKEALLSEAKEKEVNIFYLLLANLAKVSTQKRSSCTLKKKYKKLLKNKFIILKKVVRRRLDRGGYSYLIDSFAFFIDRQLIYKKEKYLKLIGDLS